MILAGPLDIAFRAMLEMIAKMDALNLNILDIGFLVVLAFFLVRALMRGLVREVLGLAGILAAILCIAVFYGPLSRLMHQLSGQPGFLWDALAFILILVIVLVVFSYLGRVLSRLVHSGPFSFIDRLAGGAIGLLKAVLVCYLLLNLLLLAVPLQVPAVLKGSQLAPYVVKAGRAVISVVPEGLTERLQRKSGLLGPSKSADKKK